MMQSILEGEPIAPAELREMLIRHILVAPDDAKGAPTTASLIDAYVNVATRTGKLDVVSGEEAERMFKGKMPAAIPSGHAVYPREVLSQVRTAMSLSKD